jgi:RNA polymerase sigma factor for flagellar operon FliA
VVSLPEARERFTANLALIERAVAFACRRYGFDGEDAKDFGASVKLKLVDDDYAVVRAYEQRSSFATYISIVVQRMALDYRIQMWGKWHVSKDAQRLGPRAVEAETLLRRDGRSPQEVATILGISDAELREIVAQLPDRAPRHREVAIGEAEAFVVSSPATAEERVMEGHRRRASQELSAILSAILGRLPDDDRLILQLRFEGGMTVAQIARMLQRDQKVLYRRIEKQMRDMKRELEAAGISPGDVADLIGRDEAILDFQLGNSNRRPSIPRDETTVAHTEGS